MKDIKKIKSIIKEVVLSLFKTEKEPIVEGVSYDIDKGEFAFDFNSDDERSIIKLNKSELKKVDFYGDTHYFGYEFEKTTNSDLRKKFINAIKFDGNFQTKEDFNTFIVNAVVSLNKTVGLIKFNTFVYPELQSNLNRKIMTVASKLTYSDNHISFELIKELPNKITFDFRAFKEKELNLVDEKGNPKYTQHAKEEVLKNIENILLTIHGSDYFSIARSVKNNKYNQYFQHFLKFKNEEDAKDYQALKNTNILIFDDVTTTGTTLQEILRVLRTINEDNKIVLFTLFGKKF